MEEEKYLGYIKYEGKLVENGLMDGKQQAYALLELDHALKYFIGKQAPNLRNLDFEIPIRIRKGSWEALIPETAAGWATAGLGIVATAYFSKAAQKMAERDFEEFGLKDVFRKSMEAVKWFAAIGKHIGDLTIKSFENVKIDGKNGLIGIVNANGEFLYVPKEMLELYASASPKLMERMASNVEEGRTLAIGSIDSKGIDEVKITVAEKAIFCEEEPEEDEEVLFPELVHGDYVVLEGEVTRENKTSNSMGFKYNDHILTSYPESGSIVPFKPLLFLQCRLHGYVNRLDERGKVGARRPKLYFSHLEPLEGQNENELNLHH